MSGSPLVLLPALHLGEGAIAIGDNAFIRSEGAGIRIGADPVIGAGSVVTSSIPAGVIAAGNPARVVREL